MSRSLPLNVPPSLQKSWLSSRFLLCDIYIWSSWQDSSLTPWSDGLCIEKQPIQEVYFQPILSACSFAQMIEVCFVDLYWIALADLEPEFRFLPDDEQRSVSYICFGGGHNSVAFLPLRCRSISIDWLEIFSVIRLLSTACKLQASGGLDAAARFTQGLFLPRYKKHAGSGSLHENATFSILPKTISKNIHDIKHSIVNKRSL